MRPGAADVRAAPGSRLRLEADRVRRVELGTCRVRQPRSAHTLRQYFNMSYVCVCV